MFCKYKTRKTRLNSNAYETNKRFQLIITQEFDIAMKWSCGGRWFNSWHGIQTKDIPALLIFAVQFPIWGLSDLCKCGLCRVMLGLKEEPVDRQNQQQCLPRQLEGGAKVKEIMGGMMNRKWRPECCQLIVRCSKKKCLYLGSAVLVQVKVKSNVWKLEEGGV